MKGRLKEYLSEQPWLKMVRFFTWETNDNSQL